MYNQNNDILIYTHIYMYDTKRYCHDIYTYRWIKEQMINNNGVILGWFPLLTIIYSDVAVKSLQLTKVCTCRWYFGIQAYLHINIQEHTLHISTVISLFLAFCLAKGCRSWVYEMIYDLMGARMRYQASMYTPVLG